MKKNVVIAAALSSVLVTSSAMAWWGDHDEGKRGDHGCSYSQQEGMKHHGGMHGEKMRPRLQEHMNRTLTADEVKTLQEAKLIYKNNPNLKVGEVKATDTGYSVTIVTKKEDALVKTVDVAKNGMPLDRYQMIQERMK